MKTMDGVGLMLCRYQASLFGYSVHQRVSSKVFVKKYAHSLLGERMDSAGFLLEAIDVPQAYIEVMRNSKKGGIIYNEQSMEWIGYIYRYICYIYEQPMKKIYGLIKPNELFELYDAYHSLDNELAIKRILEAKGISFENNTNQLEELKKIYKI